MRRSLAFLLPGALLAGYAMTVIAESGEGVPVGLTHPDVAYGPHERNVLDFWQAKGEGPRPLVVFIHGGGWTQGEKPRTARAFARYLDRGISVAAINYRLCPSDPLPAPVHDAARAIQFLRWQAEAWNIDRARIALTGGSAGGCTAMWLLFHDDLADPESPDPVLRESTRVIAAAVSNAQASIDPEVVVEWTGPEILKHRMLWMSVGEPNMAAAMRNMEAHRELYRMFSPYNHVSAGDPPLMMTYSHPMALPAVNANHAIHHPVFGLKMQEIAARLGNEMHLLVTDGPRESAYASAEDFLVRTLLDEK